MSEPVVYRVRLGDRSSGRDVVAHTAMGALVLFAAELIDDVVGVDGPPPPPIKALASVTTPEGAVHTIRIEAGYERDRAVVITQTISITGLRV